MQRFVDIVGGRTGELREKTLGPDGAIFSLGGQDGGYGLYLLDHRPVFAGNFLGRSITRLTSPKPLKPGPATLRVEFACDGTSLMLLFVDASALGAAKGRTGFSELSAAPPNRATVTAALQRRAAR